MNNLLKKLRRASPRVMWLLLVAQPLVAFEPVTPLPPDNVKNRDEVEKAIPINSEYPLPKLPLEMKGQATQSPVKPQTASKLPTLEKDKAVLGKVDSAADETLVLRFGTLSAKNIDVADIVATIQKRLTQKDVTRVHVIGNTDSDKILGNARKQFKDNYALSEARAKLVADALAQAKLGIPFSYEGKGPDRPLASNKTKEGKAQNRRTEVLLYYKERAVADTPVEKVAPTLLSRLQCAPAPRATASAPQAPKKRQAVRQVVTDPPDKILTVNFKVLFSDLEEQYVTKLAKFITAVEKEKSIRQIHVRGHTDSDQIRGEARKKFKDNFELSDFRAKIVADAIATRFPKHYVSFEGKGPKEPVATNKTAAGKAKNRRTDVWVYYGERVIEKEVAQETTCPNGDCKNRQLASGTETGPFRVTVDGQPLDTTEWKDPNPTNHVDFQRCTDVALEGADIQVHFDALNQRKILNVTAYPDIVAPQKPFGLRLYSNYLDFIDRAEIRIFLATQSTRTEPLDVIAVPKRQGNFEDALWKPKNLGEAKYIAVLRVYDAEGNFDETQPKNLDVREPVTGNEIAPTADMAKVGYGENRLALSNIPVNGGTITVNGENIPSSHYVRVMGTSVPVDPSGKFVAQQILRAGKNYGVVVKVLDERGKGLQFERDLHIPANDWFLVGIADLLLGGHRSSGPANLLSTGLDHYDKTVYLDGRVAFYLKGKIQGKYLLTASADTREGPVKDIFSNFLDKDPQALFRRLDPDRFYPVYGDDSTFMEDAPTQGKFYVKIERDSSYLMWGNFRTKLTETELAQVDRGLYGLNLRLESESAERTGQRESLLDVFAATPGTIAAREEFRGTGGSHYYLQHRDLSLGSERVRIEIRDRNSGLVLKSSMLRAGEDYTLNNIQGHILLKGPLPSIADESELVRSFQLSGHLVFLVVRYEYTPSATDPRSLALGGRASHWFGDRMQLGVTASQQKQPGGDQELYGADTTVKIGDRSNVKVEVAQTTGPGTEEYNSLDGGYSFLSRPQLRGGTITARAYRVETNLGIYDSAVGAGSLTAYTKRREAGYSAPGEMVARDVEQWGARVEAPLTEVVAVQGRFDKSYERFWLDLNNVSLDSKFKLMTPLELSLGVRHDERLDRSGGLAASQFAVDMGIRDDAAAKLAYLGAEKWDVYGFGQGTLTHSQSRLRNDRLGLGGHYRWLQRLKSGGEVSTGTGGLGVRLDSEMKYDDQHDIYASYLMDNSALDSGFRPRTGGLGAMVSGVRGRYSDATSVHYEGRYLHGNQPTGLTHSFGVDLVPIQRWTMGFSAEKGNLVSQDLKQSLDRTAGSLSIGYNDDKTKGNSAFEFRDEKSSGTQRTTWLTRNQVSTKLTPSWRWLGKVNLARSHSTRGDFYDGDWTQAQLGFGYRPVENDRLNSLFKYGYFELLPSPGQLTSTGATPEFRQRTHEVSLDWIYDLSESFSLGGKTAFAIRELRQNRVAGSDWYRNDAALAIARLDYHVIYGWDAIAELRSLWQFGAKDRRAGLLLGVYRHLSNEETIKIGVGYNFTDFSDNLTDVTFNSHGWFINLVGGF